MTYNLTQFGLKQMTECGAELRKLGAGAVGIEEVANRIVVHLYTHLVDGFGHPACALVRFFKTHAYQCLSPDLQRFASQKIGGRPIAASDKCFVLLATAGQRPEWNARAESVRFKAIPIVGDQFLTQFPMFSQLLTQFGVDLHSPSAPGTNLLVDQAEHDFNVFHVEEAAGSPYIPLQEEFVVPYKIRSVIGFGSPLLSDDMFAVILFSKVPVYRETVELFKTLALCAKIAVLPFEDDRLIIS